MFDAGWSEEAFIHAVRVASLFNHWNRLVEGLGIAHDRRWIEFGIQQLHQFGYGGKKLLK